MPRFVNSFTEVSLIGEFESQLKLLERLQRAARGSLDSATAQSAANSAQVGARASTLAGMLADKQEYGRILVDNRFNRIRSGLRSLELMSLLVSGTAPENLFLFDRVAFLGSVASLPMASDDRLIALVLLNIGMDTVVNRLPASTTANYRTAALTIGKRVRAGTYYNLELLDFMIKESKKLVLTLLRQRAK